MREAQGLNYYADQAHDSLSTIDMSHYDKLLQDLRAALRYGVPVVLFGNGGSATLANHIALDLRKVSGGQIRAVSLCENMAAVTAFGNDSGYDQVFADQLTPWLQRQMPIVIGISTSGRSQNVVNALLLAQRHTAPTYGLTATRMTVAADAVEEASPVTRIVDYPLVVAADDIEVAEDGHRMILHSLVREIRIGLEAAE